LALNHCLKLGLIAQYFANADFTPFGAERTYTNTCTQNAYKFEGKERDAETQNDDFGARYYTWRFGRWLSSDWSALPVAVPYANLTNPQTLNLYSMVADDPESFADLDGHVPSEPQDEFDVAEAVYAQRVSADQQASSEKKQKAQQQSSTNQQSAQNRQPDGSYKSTPKQIAEIKEKADKKEHITTPADPLGQCVTACEHFTGVPGPTSSWRKGKAATDLTDKDIGTAIATFVGSGDAARYKADKAGHKNSAVFMGKSVGGIWVADQWPGQTPVRIWFMATHDPKNPNNASMNASHYSVILVPKK